MDIKELCVHLNMPNDVIDTVVCYATSATVSALSPTISGLTDIATAESSYLSIKNALGFDPLGLRMLTCQLLGALVTYDKYISLGIDTAIFFDTMQCLTRFCRESIKRYGTFSFDRGWWSWRQLCMNIYRIGALEYEMTTHLCSRIISIHIPSDADMTPDNVDRSINDAKAFFNKYYPEYADVPYRCESWIISPYLREILPPSSKIVRFLDRFVIDKYDSEDTGFVEWVFNVTTPVDQIDIDSLPENTSLERIGKSLLKQGKSIGAGYGYLK